MSQQEIESFWESCRQIICLLLPGLLVASITSFVDFLNKHWLREHFSCVKFIVGQVSDLTLGAAVYLGATECGVGMPGRLALVYVAVSAGQLWVRRVIDRRLDLDRDNNDSKQGRYKNGGQVDGEDTARHRVDDV